jgi:hypothetical protein
MSCYFEKQGFYIKYFGQARGTDSHTWSKDNSNQRMVGSSFGCGFFLCRLVYDVFTELSKLCR